jgi:hypothetical protein
MMLTDEVIISTAFTLHNNNALGVGHLRDNFCAPNNEEETISNETIIIESKPVTEKIILLQTWKRMKSTPYSYCCFQCVPCAADPTGVGKLHACHHMAQPANHLAAHLLAAHLFLLIPLFPSLLFHPFFPNIGAIFSGGQAKLATVQCSCGGLMGGPTCHGEKLSSHFGNAKSSCQQSQVSHGEGHIASHFQLEMF